jgi:hypothetical protein
VKHWIICVAAVVGFTVTAYAQQPDPAIGTVQQDWQAMSTAESHTAESVQKLIQAYMSEHQKALAEVYWQDACKSTPECGGSK